ncbi:MAG: alpha/beta fold hydrolase [Roseivirga sp.]
MFACSEAHQKITGSCALPQFANDKNVDCGYLEVPENRNNPDSRKIKLAYLVLKATSGKAKADPIVYLQGGPGGATLPMAGFFANSGLRRDRDFIMMDQRGTGNSHAMCSDLGDKLLAILAKDLTPEKEALALQKAAADCKAAMREDGVDQAGYNTIQNAQDLDDLRKALGYETWNLFGGSYGSRLALAYIRDFPEHSRSAVLSALFPPQTNLYENFISNLKRSLFRVFDSCEADGNCNRKYPDLKATFFETLEDLKTQPVTISWQGEPFTLNAQDFLLFTQQMLYLRNSFEQLPAYIMAVKNKNERGIRNGIQPLAGRAGLVNIAMNWSFNAYDEVGFSGDAHMRANLEANAELMPGPAFFMSDPSILEKWHPHRAPAYVNEPVVSAIPSLVANGGFDPITPPANALEAIKTLENSFYVEFPWEGHSIFGGCYFDMVSDFLNDPETKPDIDCASRKPRINWR